MGIKNNNLRNLTRMSYPKIVASGFGMLATIGTILLMLPIASRDGKSVGFLNAMFTSISASCVTGLVVYDTYTHWTIFGQIVIVCLIQIGGLGFLTILAFLSMLLNKRIGLKERSLLQESINTMYIGGIVKLTKKIVLGTTIVELIGAVLLSTRFIPKFGVAVGIYNAVFTSISAFCNAGFDLNGRLEPSSSMKDAYFSSDPIIILTLCALVAIGSIGFFVWDDVTKNRWHFSQYSLHSKLALSVTFAMTLIGTPLFLIFENHNTLEGMSFGQKILCSLFSIVVPRTAGFEIISSGDLSTSSIMLTILYMAIGGSPGSTAGGIKTTTVAVIFISLVSSLKGEDSMNVFGRRLEDNALKRACSVITINITLAFMGAFIISGIQPELPLSCVLFEVFSAINTVGMTMGITPSLSSVSLITISFLMFLGRVGSLSFALIFTEKVQGFKSAQNPVEQINIG